MTWGGVVCASVVVSGFVVTFATTITGGPEGVLFCSGLFWSLVGVIFTAFALLFLFSIWMFVSKLRKMIFDVETLIAMPLFALSAAAVALMVMMQRHPEWGWDAHRAAVEAAESPVEP